mmetsp:Transcript_4541/g.12680  ORF Transcript_4541/g.12680 Transcript_4541/m.12680 type:complete len:215 (-) Transcript_4541:760-1404(-)
MSPHGVVRRVRRSRRGGRDGQPVRSARDSAPSRGPSRVRPGEGRGAGVQDDLRPCRRVPPGGGGDRASVRGDDGVRVPPAGDEIERGECGRFEGRAGEEDGGGRRTVRSAGCRHRRSGGREGRRIRSGAQGPAGPLRPVRRSEPRFSRGEGAHYLCGRIRLPSPRAGVVRPGLARSDLHPDRTCHGPIDRGSRRQGRGGHLRAGGDSLRPDPSG